MAKSQKIHQFIATIAALCLAALFRCGGATDNEGHCCQTSAPMVLICEEMDFSNIHSAIALVDSIRRLIGSGAGFSENQRQLESFINAYHGIICGTHKTWREWQCAITNAIGSSGELYYFNCEWVVKNGGKVLSFNDLLCVPRERNAYCFDAGHYVDPLIFKLYCDRQAKIIAFTQKCFDKISEAMGHDYVANKTRLLETLTEIESMCNDLKLRGTPWFEDLKVQLEEFGLDSYNNDKNFKLYFSSSRGQDLFVIKRGPFTIKRIRCDKCIP